LFKRLPAAVWIAVLSLAAFAPPAAGSVTIGQVADPNAGNCSAGTEFIQLGVTSGNSYVVPGNGTITSWTMQAGDAGDLTMKIYRKVADPATYQVVGHAGPERLTAGGTVGNTFPANVRVRRGDLLGLHPVTESPCGFKDPGGQLAIFSGDLADGDAMGFGADSGSDLDIQATFVPDNSFSVGGTTRNKKKGTATLAVDVPNPGELTGSGKGVAAAPVGALTSKSVAAGTAQLLIKPKGRAKRTLNETGKVKLKVAITYTPTGGDPGRQFRKVKLEKRLH
jgi:hypothetical protein